MIEPPEAVPEKRIKRQIIGRPHDFFAVTLPGYEHFTSDEISDIPLSASDIVLAPGGVAFRGRLHDAYAANLTLRCAGRVLMRMAEFPATNFRTLEKRLAEIPWELYFYPDVAADIRGAASRSRLYHTDAVAERIHRSIRERFSGQAASPAKSPQRIYIRAVDDVITISADTTGENLYKRGLKSHSVAAPLRETTAALILKLAGYDPGEPLVDPMCGSGTFSLEAAMVAARIPPGNFRDFAFTEWPSFQPKRWAHIQKTFREKIVTDRPEPTIFAGDVDVDACDRLAKCVADYGLASLVRLRPGDIFEMEPPDTGGRKGLLVLNPPYGIRLVIDDGPKRFFKRLGKHLRRTYRGWKAAVIVPDRSLIETMPAGLRAHPLPHGGMAVTLMAGRIS